MPNATAALGQADIKSEPGIKQEPGLHQAMPPPSAPYGADSARNIAAMRAEQNLSSAYGSKAANSINAIRAGAARPAGQPPGAPATGEAANL
jgi:hypothetical protein